MTASNAIFFWFGTAAIFAYLIGGVPFGLLIARSKGIDIRKVGSGNIGATNVFRAVGKAWGVLTFFCDAAKGWLAAWPLPKIITMAAKLDPSAASLLAIVCAAAAVCGHNWPIYLRFRGGKGVATGAGALLALAPGAMGIGLTAWGLVFAATRYVSVASITAAGAVASASWFLSDKTTAGFLTILSILIIWRHKANIQRLRNGTEHRFGAAKNQSL